MKANLVLFCVLIVWLPIYSYSQAIFYSSGADMIIESGALMYVEGDVVIADSGTNISQIRNLGDIQLEGNWTNKSTGNVFTAGDPGTTTFLGTSALQEIGGSTVTNFNNLAITKPGVSELRVNLDGWVDGVLDLNDDFLNIQDHDFFLRSTNANAIQRTGPIVAPYTNNLTEGYIVAAVNGRLLRATVPGNTYFFPMGASGRFRPVEISGSGINTHGVSFVNGTTPNSGLVLSPLNDLNDLYYHKLYRITSNGQSDDITIYAEPIADNICETGNVRLAEWNGSAWEALDNTSATINSFPQLSAFTTTSYPGSFATPYNSEDFALGGLTGSTFCTVLSAESLDLKAVPQSDLIQISWKMESVTHIERILLERGTGPSGFETIARKEPVSHYAYFYDDKDVQPGITYYYRLRQINQDGSELLSEHVSAKLGLNEVFWVSELFPNPASSETKLTLLLEEPALAKWELFNPVGQLVKSESRLLFIGNHEINIGLEGMAKGNYTLRLQLNEDQYVRKLSIYE